MFKEYISNFHHDHYQSAIKILSFPDMEILGKNHVGKTRHEDLERISLKKNIKCSQDYNERLVVEFTTEIQ